MAKSRYNEQNYKSEEHENNKKKEVENENIYCENCWDFKDKCKCYKLTKI